MSVSIKFSDSRSNGLRDIRGADFVSLGDGGAYLLSVTTSRKPCLKTIVAKKCFKRIPNAFSKMAYSNSAKRDCVSPKKQLATRRLLQRYHHNGD